MLFRKISTEKQSPLAQMESKAKIAVLMSIDELEHIELCQDYCGVQTEILSSVHIASTGFLAHIR